MMFVTVLHSMLLNLGKHLICHDAGSECIRPAGIAGNRLVTSVDL